MIRRLAPSFADLLYLATYFSFALAWNGNVGRAESEPVWFASGDLLRAFTHLAGGAPVTTVAWSALAALCSTILLRDGFRRGSGAAVAAVGALTGMVALAQLVVSPASLMAFTMLAWVFALVERDRGRPDLAIWWVVPVAAAWSNIHSSFWLLPLYLALYTGSLQLEYRLTRNPATLYRRRRLVVVCIASLLATLINPLGPALHAKVFAWLIHLHPPAHSGAAVLWLAMGAVLSLHQLRRGMFAEPIVLSAFTTLGAVYSIEIYTIAIVPALAAEVTWIARRIRRGPRKSLLSPTAARVS